MADFPRPLIQQPEVQKELNLGKEQIQKIDQFVRGVREKQQQELQELRNLPPSERRRKQADLAGKVTQEIQRRLTEVLKPKQARRLEQIRRQQQGLRAFEDPEVEKALHLTGEQKNRLKTINADAAREARMLFRSGTPSSFQETMTKIETIGHQAVAKAVALLTDEQKKIWQELTGKPFELHSEQPRIRPPE
jgi:hypothetical protein